MNLREKTMILGYVFGVRLRSFWRFFQFLAGVPQAALIFHVVCFIVLTSVLIEESSIPLGSQVVESGLTTVTRTRWVARTLRQIP